MLYASYLLCWVSRFGSTKPVLQAAVVRIHTRLWFLRVAQDREKPAECDSTGRVFQQANLRVKICVQMLSHSERCECAKKPKCRQQSFLPPVIRNITGAIDTSSITALFWRLNKPPATDWLRIGYLREKALLLRDEVGEFSFYKGNISCRNIHHGKQIT
jgi:hypothetical protein